MTTYTPRQMLADFILVFGQARKMPSETWQLASHMTLAAPWTHLPHRARRACRAIRRQRTRYETLRRAAEHMIIRADREIARELAAKNYGAIINELMRAGPMFPTAIPAKGLADGQRNPERNA